MTIKTRLVEYQESGLAFEGMLAWDDEAEAKEFEKAVRDHGCRQARWAGPDRRIEAGILVRRDGVRVVVARGLDELDARAAVEAMLLAPLYRPPPRPVSVQ